MTTRKTSHAVAASLLAILVVLWGCMRRADYAPDTTSGKRRPANVADTPVRNWAGRRAPMSQWSEI